MSKHYHPSLNPKKALIWRIVHRNNLPWILDNGLHCSNSEVQSPDWVSIGNAELIDRRSRCTVPLPPHGVLNDYVPFYFTPFSPMLHNIRTGWGGIARQANQDIVILVSSLPRIEKSGRTFLFTDSHACSKLANFYSNLQDLDKIDWPLLQMRDFQRDREDPAKFERYQAEALIYRYLPADELLGIVCYTDEVQQDIAQQLNGLELSAHVRPKWYFE